MQRGFAPGLQKECTRLATASDKVYQLLAHGRWFSPGTPASPTTKTGRHDKPEILLKVALNTINQIKLMQSHSRKNLLKHKRFNCYQATGKLYHLRLRVESTFFVIYKVRREPTPYW
jgi:hypothetical protein